MFEVNKALPLKLTSIRGIVLNQHLLTVEDIAQGKHIYALSTNPYLGAFYDLARFCADLPLDLIGTDPSMLLMAECVTFTKNHQGQEAMTVHSWRFVPAHGAIRDYNFQPDNRPHHLLGHIAIWPDHLSLTVGRDYLEVYDEPTNALSEPLPELPPPPGYIKSPD